MACSSKRANPARQATVKKGANKQVNPNSSYTRHGRISYSTNRTDKAILIVIKIGHFGSNRESALEEKNWFWI